MKYRAFVSSTFVDLRDHRAHVISALRSAGIAVDPMEEWTADSDEPKKFSQDRLDGCDLCILLVAFRRGFVPEAETLSITQFEYEAAVKKKIDILPFMLDEEAPWRAIFDDRKTDPEINRWRSELRKKHGVQLFNLEPASIVMTGALVRWLSKENAQKPAPGILAEAGNREAPKAQLTWDIRTKGSPYPGLMHFTRNYAPVFFGRDDEIREILYRMQKPEGRFIIVSGDSGVGKSSVVDAGILPKLEEGALPGSLPCVCVRMVPGQSNQPFAALTTALGAYATRAGLRPDSVVEELSRSPETFTEQIRRISSGGTDGKQLVLFVDQMEELFTAQDIGESNRFLTYLHRAAFEQALWVIATIRSDHLHFCHRHPEMLDVLKGSGHYPLGRVEPYKMTDMIVKPAHCAGLSMPDGLMRRLIRDIGSESVSLPLLAFALEQLFNKRSDNVLSEDVYTELGGIAGAIGAHVTTVEKRLAKEFGADANTWLPKIFPSLVVVNIDGQPTRGRALKKTLAADLQPIVDVLSKERLLSAEGEGQQSTVSVAHEKLFDTWPALSRWVAENRDDYFVLRQAEIEAKEWVKHDYALAYLWHSDRMLRLRTIVERVGADDIEAVVRQYVAPQDRLIERLCEDTLSHHERLSIGQYLAALGDPRRGVGLTEEGLSDIEWVKIPRRTVKLEGVKGGFKVKPFRIAKYLVTNMQFQAFIDADDGYRIAKWWEDIEQIPAPSRSSWSEHNSPRTDVSWYEAVAFCRWLSARLAKKIRLPAEWEWQQAATGCDAKNVYPWGREWEGLRCNSTESELRRTTAVGIYPKGATRQGVLDMAGNVWEWCQNNYENPDAPSAINIDKSGGQRVIRGGSWYDVPVNLRSSFRSGDFAVDRGGTIGFRLAQDLNLLFVLCPFTLYGGEAAGDFLETDMAASVPQAVQSCHELLLWLVPQLDKLPRARRFTLGERIEAGIIEVLELLVEAAYTRNRLRAWAEAQWGW